MAKHQTRLDAFLNSLQAKGVKLETINNIRTAITADDSAIDPIAEGVMAESDYHRQQNLLTTERSTFEQQRQQWQGWYQNAQTQYTTLQQAAQRAAQLEGTLNAIATNEGINLQEYGVHPSTGTAPVFNPNSTQPGNPNPSFNPNPSTSRAAQQPADIEGRFRTFGNELIDGIAQRDEINARHFELTGKPLNSAPVIQYMREQAAVGNHLNFEQAWRLTQNIDTLEQTAAAAAKTAEHAALRAQWEAEQAGKTSLPNDPAPQFQHARIFQTVQPAQNAQAQPPANGGQPPATPQQPAPERTGHQARSQAAASALQEMQRRRRMGLPSQYEQPAGQSA